MITATPNDKRFWKRVKKTDQCWLWTGVWTRTDTENFKSHSAAPRGSLRLRRDTSGHIGTLSSCRRGECLTETYFTSAILNRASESGPIMFEKARRGETLEILFVEEEVRDARLQMWFVAFDWKFRAGLA